jgi:hypothetical protein
LAIFRAVHLNNPENRVIVAEAHWQIILWDLLWDEDSETLLNLLDKNNLGKSYDLENGQYVKLSFQAP